MRDPWTGLRSPSGGTATISGPPNWLRDNSSAFLRAGAGLLSGQNANQQLALGLQGFASGIDDRNQRRQRNQTVEWLKAEHPELAEMVELGMAPTEALKLVHQAKAKTPQEPEFDEYGFPISGSISQKRRALEMQGIDTQRALGMASGRYQTSVNPMTGERVLVDIASGQIVPLEQPQYETPTVQAPQSVQAQPQSGLYGQAGEATGVGSSVANTLSNTLGQVPGAIGDAATFPEQVQAGQEFELFKRDLIRSLSLNPRFPVAEQQRIESLVPRGPMTAPDTLRTSLRALDAELGRIEAQLTAAINDPTVPVTQKQQDGATLRSIRSARERLAVPQSGSSPPTSNDGWTELPNGVRIRETSQ